MVRALHHGSDAMRTESQGFSLIEVLVATTITVIALSGLAHVFVLASAANRAARTRTIAAMLARDKMEELLSRDDELVSGRDFIGGRGEWLGDSSPPPGTVLVRQWTVSPGAGFLPRARVLTVWITTRDASNELVRVVGAREGSVP
jgi:prepilin-type N-terminal cleavage/methylation domain-containing protein